MRARIFILAGLLLTSPPAAQQSAGFKLTEHTFNAGGHPTDGEILTSASFKISVDAIGEAVVAPVTSGASFAVEGGFVAGFPPPGEISGVLFADAQTLIWHPDRATGVYNLYRDLMSSLVDLGFGVCEQQDLATHITTDGDVPAAGDGYFYLLTAENRLGEEGSKGRRSSGDERPNPAPCP